MDIDYLHLIFLLLSYLELVTVINRGYSARIKRHLNKVTFVPHMSRLDIIVRIGNH